MVPVLMVVKMVGLVSTVETNALLIASNAGSSIPRSVMLVTTVFMGTIAVRAAVLSVSSPMEI